MHRKVHVRAIYWNYLTHSHKLNVFTYRAQMVAVTSLSSVYATNDGGVIVTSNLGSTGMNKTNEQLFPYSHVHVHTVLLKRSFQSQTAQGKMARKC